MHFIDLKAQYQHLKKRIDKRIQNVLDHGQYISGPEVQELEERLAEYVGVKHVITCANGTDALQLSLMALGIGQGDAVFCPTFTYFATAEAIASCGATPVFVDSDERTFNMCPTDLELRIKRTFEPGELKLKAIIAVDLFGLPANYPELEKIAKKYNLKLIEDAAQGFGGEINGKRAGSFGDIATTSFFPAKPLGCYGDGGAIFTDNNEVAERLRSLCVHGKGVDKYDNVRIGMNSRLDTMQAAILLEKLAAFPDELEKRQQVAEKYFQTLDGDILSPNVPNGYLSSWAQFTILSDERECLRSKLKKMNIPSMVYYIKCMHQQTAFERLISTNSKFLNAEKITKSVLSLPMHAYLSAEEIKSIKLAVC